MLRIERHPLGPRLFLLGARVHEFGVGFAALAVLALGELAGAWEITWRLESLSALAAFFVVKDWRYLVPSKRNTAAWGLLPHRVPTEPAAVPKP